MKEVGIKNLTRSTISRILGPLGIKTRGMLERERSKALKEWAKSHQNLRLDQFIEYYAGKDQWNLSIKTVLEIFRGYHIYTPGMKQEQFEEEVNVHISDKKSAAALQRALDEREVIETEIHRIWAVPSSSYRTDLMRLNSEFNPDLLVNRGIGKKVKTLTRSYRDVILKYAYRLYGAELIQEIRTEKLAKASRALEAAIKNVFDEKETKSRTGDQKLVEAIQSQIDGRRSRLVRAVPMVWSWNRPMDIFSGSEKISPLIMPVKLKTVDRNSLPPWFNILTLEVKERKLREIYRNGVKELSLETKQYVFNYPTLPLTPEILAELRALLYWQRSQNINVQISTTMAVWIDRTLWQLAELDPNSEEGKELAGVYLSPIVGPALKSIGRENISNTAKANEFLRILRNRPDIAHLYERIAHTAWFWMFYDYIYRSNFNGFLGINTNDEYKQILPFRHAMGLLNGGSYDEFQQEFQHFYSMADFMINGMNEFMPYTLYLDNRIETFPIGERVDNFIKTIDEKRYVITQWHINLIYDALSAAAAQGRARQAQQLWDRLRTRFMRMYIVETGDAAMMSDNPPLIAQAMGKLRDLLKGKDNGAILPLITILENNYTRLSYEEVKIITEAIDQNIVLELSQSPSQFTLAQFILNGLVIYAAHSELFQGRNKPSLADQISWDQIKAEEVAESSGKYFHFNYKFGDKSESYRFLKMDEEEGYDVVMSTLSTQEIELAQKLSSIWLVAEGINSKESSKDKVALGWAIAEHFGLIHTPSDQTHLPFARVLGRTLLEYYRAQAGRPTEVPLDVVQFLIKGPYSEEARNILEIILSNLDPVASAVYLHEFYEKIPGSLANWPILAAKIATIEAEREKHGHPEESPSARQVPNKKAEGDNIYVFPLRPRSNNKEPSGRNGDKTPNKAMRTTQNGGIDLTLSKMKLQTQNSGREIKFRIDPAMLQQLQNAPGFTPVIINIQPVTDLKMFLGLSETTHLPAGRD